MNRSGANLLAVSLIMGRLGTSSFSYSDWFVGSVPALFDIDSDRVVCRYKVDISR